MATTSTSNFSRPRRRTGDVNGLFLVLGALALLMVSLPCPMSAASQTGAPETIEAPLSATKR